MSTKARIQADLVQAMRQQNKATVAALRLITSAIKQIEVDERIELDEARLLALLDKLAKQRRESIAQFKLAAREDLVAQEEFELQLIATYLPTPLSDEEIHAMVAQTIQALDAKSMADMGKVMAQLKPLVQGRCDMSHISVLIKAQLQA